MGRVARVYQRLDLALVIPPAGSAIAVSEQAMRQEPAEERGPQARSVEQDLRDQAAVVVVELKQRHPAEEGKGVDVAIDPRLDHRRQ